MQNRFKKEFPNMASLYKASVDDLKQIKGIGDTRARKIKTVI